MENVNNQIKAVVVIIKAGFADEVMKIAREAGAKGATIMNVRGEGSIHQSFMGITLDSEKEMILILANADTANHIIAAIEEKAGLKSSAHGICFVMPVEKVIGINHLIKEEGQEEEKGK